MFKVIIYPALLHATFCLALSFSFGIVAKKYLTRFFPFLLKTALAFLVISFFYFPVFHGFRFVIIIFVVLLIHNFYQTLYVDKTKISRYFTALTHALVVVFFLIGSMGIAPVDEFGYSDDFAWSPPSAEEKYLSGLRIFLIFVSSAWIGISERFRPFLL